MDREQIEEAIANKTELLDEYNGKCVLLEVFDDVVFGRYKKEGRWYSYSYPIDHPFTCAPEGFEPQRFVIWGWTADRKDDCIMVALPTSSSGADFYDKSPCWTRLGTFERVGE